MKWLLGGAALLPGSFLAVDLFFLMSGLVVSHAYDNRLVDGRLSLGRFVWLRIVRLFPLYLTACAIGASYFLSKMLLAVDDAPSVGQMLYGALAALLILPAVGAEGWGFGVFPFAPSAWSLALEFWFNVVYAMLVVGLGTRALWGLALAALALLCHQAWAFGSLDLGWGVSTLLGGSARFWFSFTLGVILRRTLMARAPSTPWAIALVPLAFGFVLLPHNAVSLQLLWIVVVFPAFVLLSARTPLPPFGGVVADHLGRLSYGLYILHAPIIMLSLGVLKQVPGAPLTRFPTQIGLAILVVVVLATVVLTYGFEEPLRRRLARRRQAAQPAPDPVVAAGDQTATPR